MKADDLFDAIASFPALSAAARRAALGKRAKPGAAAFLANQEKEILRLEHEFRRGRYRPGRYRTMEIFDPKHRLVSAAPFRDRVVHHAFCMVCEPVFEHGFIHDSYANRKGKGTHRAVARYERFGDRFRYVLRGGGPASPSAMNGNRLPSSRYRSVRSSAAKTRGRGLCAPSVLTYRGKALPDTLPSSACATLRLLCNAICETGH